MVRAVERMLLEIREHAANELERMLEPVFAVARSHEQRRCARALRERHHDLVRLTLRVRAADAGFRRPHETLFDTAMTALHQRTRRSELAVLRALQAFGHGVERGIRAQVAE